MTENERLLKEYLIDSMDKGNIIHMKKDVMQNKYTRLYRGLIYQVEWWLSYNDIPYEMVESRFINLHQHMATIYIPNQKIAACCIYEMRRESDKLVDFADFVYINCVDISSYFENEPIKNNHPISVGYNIDNIHEAADILQKYGYMGDSAIKFLFKLSKEDIPYDEEKEDHFCETYKSIAMHEMTKNGSYLLNIECGEIGSIISLPADDKKEEEE